MNPKPFNEGFLPEQDGHKVYYAQYGNPEGVPILTLHGGPGSKSKRKHAARFDLEKYHVVAFDQRGCGKSEPAGHIIENTTQRLIEDIERLREHLAVETWHVAGGSWGATLALLYAEAFSDRVRGLLLSSVFLAREKDVSHAFTQSGGVGKFFPDVWERRLEFLARHGAEPSNAATVLLEKLKIADKVTAQEIVAGVENWESNLFSPYSDVYYKTPEEISDDDIADAKIFLHYEANKFFLKPNQIIADIKKIRELSVVIVHGRYDILCPLDGVWALKRGIDDVEIVILPSSGHSLTAEGEAMRKYAFDTSLGKWGK